MLRKEDSETEIVLGNKQLLGIFFVVAVLLGIAFYGGYMVGKAAPAKPIQTATAARTTTRSTPAAGETRTIPGDTSSGADVNPTDATEPPATEPPLGTPKSTAKARPTTPDSVATPPIERAPIKTSANFTPEPGQQFLQVAAVGRDQALGVADVLHAKGFRAHAVPKPGDSKTYRVLIGPLRDAGDLSATRDALRTIGFREVIVQKY
ncbi:MAG: SPOR domain-containing protein [Acidobacteriaceae bacterium]|nr:SPOR domain-containing protein [Acidobacteriaceae bacterium]